MNGFLAILVFTLLLNGTVEAQVVISSNVNSPKDGDTVTLTCSITGFATSAFWFNNSNNAILNDCLPDGTCTTGISGRYSYSANASAIIIRITSFSSTQDAFVWKCQHSSFTTTFSFPKTTDTSSSTGTGNSEEVKVGAACVALGIVLLIVGIVLIVVYQLYKFNGFRIEAIAVIACELHGFVLIGLGSYLINNKGQGLTGGAIAGIVVAVIGFLILVVGVYFIIKYHWSKSNDVKNKTVGTNNSENRNPTRKPEAENIVLQL